MKQRRRLFVVSDIHGHYTLLRKALKEAGFDENNDEHLFICCGDLFDRGQENRKVYHYIRRLKHKVLIMGNHDERLVEMLQDRQILPVDIRNGKGTTLTEFFGPHAVDSFGNLQLPKYGKMSFYLQKFIGSMRNYYETDHYVFTHGYLPLVPDSNISTIREDWRTANPSTWRTARFLQWQLLYHTPARIPGKTIICGHRTAAYGHHFDPQRSEEDTSIFRGDGIIAIDACTVLSGHVNVLVLDEEIETDEL